MTPSESALLRAVAGQADNVVTALVGLIKGALDRESPQLLAARAEAVAMLTGYKTAVETAAEAKRAELAKGV